MNVVLNFDLSGINDNNAISIHKVYDNDILIKPGESREVRLLIFPRRIGFHTLKGFKVFDKTLMIDPNHKDKGYVVAFPKYSVE